MFGKAPRPPETQPQPDGLGNNQLADMALDTVAGILRNLAEFALEQEGVELQTFRANAEAWAKHVTLATAPPGAADDDPKARKGRREWEAVRRFVRDYCQGSCARTVTMTADLRQVIWVFIRNISQAFTQDEEIDSRLRTQMGRLETLVETNATAELKREVLDAVGTFKQILKERSDRQRNQMEFLGAQVRALGDDLESARRESETDPLTRIPILQMRFGEGKMALEAPMLPARRVGQGKDRQPSSPPPRQAHVGASALEESPAVHVTDLNLLETALDASGGT
jgi:hypothetical protein